MERRNFLKNSSLAGLGFLPAFSSSLENASSRTINPPANDRAFWADLLNRIAAPVLGSMALGKLHERMEVEYSPIWDGRNKGVAHMEAFGRLMAGLAPWLALPEDASAEGKTRKRLHEQALASYAHAVDPRSPDYLLWNEGGQPLVDAAFVAHSFLRAPDVLWKPLSNTTKQQYIKEFMGLRRVKPPYTNWLLFSAIVEAFLLSIGEAYDPFRIDIATRKMKEWYVGDGWYSDGQTFSFDYYNAFVIHSMLNDVLKVTVRHKKSPEAEYKTALKRMQRYSESLERLISPEASFPAFGRSITYRTGAFQPLAQLALEKQLPESLAPAQVRSALTAVKQRMFGMSGIFNKEGFLQLGFAGHQPGLADSYSNSGSLYLTSLSFLPLGLPAEDPFWKDPAMEWTAVKAWKGEPFKKDYRVEY